MFKNGSEFNNFDEFISFCERGGELEFIYNGHVYWTTMSGNGKRIAYEAYNEESIREYNTPQEVLEHEIEEKKLKDILFDIEVTDRSF
ncbi:MAG: hypothetical protein FWE47_01385 [Oscillospiraceae bacterium]|nr:hypothetical protein [Oscillospiraceae bacterium]